MSEQPTSLVNDMGVVLTVGINVFSDRTAIVLPMVSNASSLTAVTLCEDAVQSFLDQAILQLQNCMSNDCYITFLQGEGMVDGKVPYRKDFTLDDFPGTYASITLPAQNAGLVVFYQDPAQVAPGARIACGKTFIPGLPQSMVVGSDILAELIGKMNTLGTKLQGGYPSTASSSDAWYRVLATPKPRTAGTIVDRTINRVARGYVSTQKRRMLPR